MSEKLIANIKIWISVMMITGMVFISEILGESEIIFPEIAALTIGAWIAEKQPWKVNRIKMFLLMSVSAFMGYAISSFILIPIFFKAIIGFAFCVLLLLLSKSTMLPMISACILPILFETKSIIYPLSVVAMTGIIVLVQWLCEKKGLKQKQTYEKIVYDKKAETIRWLFLFIVVILMCASATIFNVPFIVAPPLIVTFCEFSYTDSKARSSPIAIFLLVIFCACFGTCAKFLLCRIIGLPLTAVAFIVTIFVMYMMVLLKKTFPPAGAIMLLPLLINNDSLFVYPYEVMIGSAVFISLSMLFGNIVIKRRKQSEVLL